MGSLHGMHCAAKTHPAAPTVASIASREPSVNNASRECRGSGTVARIESTFAEAGSEKSSWMARGGMVPGSLEFWTRARSQPRQPEVRQLDHSIRRDHHVGRL